jgi:uncharacterized protein (TIGR03435 family)
MGNAKSETNFKSDQIPPMLQALLKDRFQLAIHRGTEEQPLYALVMARKDGKLGPVHRIKSGQLHSVRPDSGLEN